jgi:hypothetical protein
VDRGAQLCLARAQQAVQQDYEYRVQTSETLIDVAAIRLMLNRIAP